MFGSIALDVVIGMVFIYLLYSLLTSIIGEMISSWFGIRARLLRRAIERMLNDEYDIDMGKPNDKKWGRYVVDSLLKRIHQIGDFFLHEYKYFKYSFAGRFYEYPSIKYISEGSKKFLSPFVPKEPSYITKEVFAQTLIHLFRGKGNSDLDMNRIEFCLKFNTLHIQPQTLSYLRNLLADAKGDMQVFTQSLQNWFEETMYRTTGWYKRKNKLIMFLVGLLIAISFNVDSIKIVRLLSKDKDARGQLVTMGITVVKDSTKFKDFVNSNGDTVHPQTVLDSGFVRVTKDIADANLILGLGWNVPNTTRECEKIQKSDSVKAQKVLNRLLFWQVRDSTLRIIADNKCFSDSITFYRFHYDSLRVKLVLDSFTKDEEAQIKKKMISDSTEIAKTTERDKNLSSVLYDCRDSINKVTLELGKIIGKNFVRIDSIVSPKNPTMIYGETPRCAFAQFWYQIGFVLGQSLLPWKLEFWGFLITALMLSLGAPFWFGVLQKLAAIRSTGVKPEEKKEQKEGDTNKQPAPVAGGLNLVRKPIVEVSSVSSHDFIDEAIRLFADEMRKISGVKAIFKGFVDIEKNERRCLQVNVSDDDSKKAIKAMFPKILVTGTAVPLRIVVAGHPRPHQSQQGQISNKSNQNGFGSLGMVLRDKFDNTSHILSCWHVMKGNLDYDHDDEFKTILDYSGEDIGIRWAGGIQGSVDYGLAQVNALKSIDNEFLRSKLDFSAIRTRPLIDNDVDTHITIKFYDSLNEAPKKGKILTNCSSVPIAYCDRDRNVTDILLLIDSLTSDEKPISQPGNSGAVVFDEQGFGIAMVIGGDNKYTYAMKLSNFFDTHDEMLIA